MKVAVLGAGAAGLAAARSLQQVGAGAPGAPGAPIDVVVFEADARAGGKIQTHAEAGYRCEAGPNSIAAASPTTLRLARELGLALVEARKPRTRFVVRGGRMRAAPSLGLLSPLGWARALAEPLVAGHKPADRPEESLSAFFVRHLGREAGGLAATLMAAGVYAGDPQQLSSRDAFPKITALEDLGGSLMVGAFRRPRAAPAVEAAPASLWSLTAGLGALPDALAAQLGPALKLSTRVEQVQPLGAGYRIQLSGAAAGEVQVDGIVSALPPRATAALLGPIAPELAQLAAIRSSPIAVAHLAFRATDVARPPKGFGVLDGDGSLAPVLGILFPSSLFAGRAPDRDLLFTALLGGVSHPEVLDLDDDALAATCQTSLHTLFGASAPPVYRRIVRWREAVPQPELGHAQRVAAARAAAGRLPPLELAGAAFGGAAVEQVLAGGEAAAQRLRARLARVEA